MWNVIHANTLWMIRAVRNITIASQPIKHGLFLFLEIIVAIYLKTIAAVGSIPPDDEKISGEKVLL